jgi:D-alanyl-D-alanine carboxypeptidase (penicillin-binding protein 5/6)
MSHFRRYGTAVRPVAALAVLAAAVVMAPAALAAPAKPVASASPAALAVAGRRPPAGIAAAAAELANGITGKPLWGRQRYAARPIASITKIMTALVVLDAGHLRRQIRITQADVDYVTGNGTSSAGLRAGDVLTVRQLLYAMLLPSGADAALALATSYGPGWPAFVRKMNATARTLHLTKTHFTNFDGLQASDVSSPRNLLMLGGAVMRQPDFASVVRRKWYFLPATRQHHQYFWRNTNLLLSRYPHVIGIKTGWTPAAGECLLFEATDGKRELIGVVLDSAPTKTNVSFTDAARLLNWGFGAHVAAGTPASFGRVPGD